MAGTLIFWPAAVAALAVRIIISFYAADLNLGFRPEVATPVTSLRRLAEGYWLKNSSMSPYSGSMYHGSPLLLTILGPFTTQSSEDRIANWQFHLLFVIVDFITALLIRAIGQKLLSTRSKTIEYLKLPKIIDSSGSLNAGNIASLVYLWNPLTILACVGSSTSPIDNLMVVLSIYGACSRLPSLAAFGWVFASHFSLYPVILIVPIILLLGYGLDSPPRKLFQLKDSKTSKDIASSTSHGSYKTTGKTKGLIHQFSWKPVVHFFFWSVVWAGYILFLCCASLKDLGALSEMFRKMYGFMLTVEDLSPNIGVQWYFFAEVFEFFRSFFLIVFHMNVFFMVLPLAICLKHRPCFLAFVYITISSMLKSYPSVGDLALYLGLLGLFANELAEMHFSFLLFWGYVGVTLLSPVMHNLWIWRGTGNANFYFATGLAYACLQTVLIVESVSTMLKYDRMVKKQAMAGQ